MSAAVTHRSLAGEWELCADAASCGLLFHFPGTTPEEMAGVPLRALLPLLEVIDPPTEVDEDGWRLWKPRREQVGLSRRRMLHRDYDLPAAVHPDGSMMWYQAGLLHREGDRPAAVYPSGELHWYRDGKLNRDGDEPAVTMPDGTREWWQAGVSHRDRTLGSAILASPKRAGSTGWQIIFMEYGELLSMAYTAGPEPRPEQLEYRHWAL